MPRKRLPPVPVAPTSEDTPPTKLSGEDQAPTATPVESAATSVSKTRRAIEQLGAAASEWAQRAEKAAASQDYQLKRAAYLMGQLYCRRSDYSLAVAEFLNAGDECPREELVAATTSCIEHRAYARAIGALVILRDGPRLIAVAQQILKEDGRESDERWKQTPLARLALIEAAKLGM